MIYEPYVTNINIQVEIAIADQPIYVTNANIQVEIIFAEYDDTWGPEIQILY